jgi:ATP-dependent RNA helicase DDX10/DBP4
MDAVKRKTRLSRTTKKTLAKKKQAREREEIDELGKAITAWNPEAPVSRFDELPVSKATLAALKQARFEEMTAIQRAAIPVALSGRSVVATAKTGSGKTLAFLVPLVERLHREQWTRENGVGAIVVSPTRELAAQTFEVLKVVGAHHKLHGGLMIGRGQDLLEERANASTYSVIIATPGRLLQHLDEASELRTDMLQMIVFDECDRLLDMGFEKTIDAILGHLPRIEGSGGLQCLLFSATNNKKLVADRLSGVDFAEVDPQKMAMPGKLRHFAMRVSLEQKLTMLWSFIKQHMFSKARRSLVRPFASV